MSAAIKQARQYLAKLPSADGHEAIWHPSGVVAALDEQAPASSILLTTVKAFAMGYLQQEREDATLCCDAQHHKDICGLFAAIEREGEGGTSIPDVLFDGSAVYDEVCRGRGKLNFYVSTNAVSDVLDAVVRLLRAPTAIAATKEGA